MTTSNVEFISEVQGRVILPRAKIAQITLHEVTPHAAINKPTGNAPLILSGSSSPPVNFPSPTTAPYAVAVAPVTPATSAPASGHRQRRDHANAPTRFWIPS